MSWLLSLGTGVILILLLSHTSRAASLLWCHCLIEKDTHFSGPSRGCQGLEKPGACLHDMQGGGTVQRVWAQYHVSVTPVLLQ